MAATLNGAPATGTSWQEREYVDGREDQSLGELASDLVGNAQELVRCELELAKLELKEEAKGFAKGAGMAGAGAVFGLVTLFMLAHTIAWALAGPLPVWAAFLITTVLFGAIAGGLAMVGIKRLKQVQPTPTNAIEKTKEDVSWIKTHT